MADWAHGTTIGYANEGTAYDGSFTDIATVVEIDDKKLKRDSIKTTVLASANNTETARAGMVKPEAFKFKIQYGKALHDTLLTLFHSSTPNKAWQIGLTDGSKITGDGFMSEMCEVPKSTNDAIYENEISIMPVGKWSFHAAA